MFDAKYSHTPEEIDQMITMATANIGRPETTDRGILIATIAQALAMAEIAYQLAKLTQLLSNGVDQNQGCFVTRQVEH